MPTFNKVNYSCGICGIFFLFLIFDVLNGPWLHCDGSELRLLYSPRRYCSNRSSGGRGGPGEKSLGLLWLILLCANGLSARRTGSESDRCFSSCRSCGSNLDCGWGLRGFLNRRDMHRAGSPGAMHYSEQASFGSASTGAGWWLWAGEGEGREQRPEWVSTTWPLPKRFSSFSCTGYLETSTCLEGWKTILNQSKIVHLTPNSCDLKSSKYLQCIVAMILVLWL